MTSIFVEGLTFDYAHFLPWHETCGRLHGHTGSVRATLHAALDDHGMVLDFGIAKARLKAVLAMFDHRLILNRAHAQVAGDGSIDARIERPHLRPISLSLAADEVYLLDGDPTIERIAEEIGRCAWNDLVAHLHLHRLEVECREGDGKGALHVRP